MKQISITLINDDFETDKIYKIIDSSLVMHHLQKHSEAISSIKTSGIYVLLGPAIQCRQIYIGQTSNLQRRIKEHIKAKDFWDECLCFYDLEKQLTKTEIEWLEQELIKAAISSNYIQLMKNYQIPTNTIINDIDVPRLNELFEQIKLLLNCFGLPIIAQNYSRDFLINTSSNGILNRLVKSYIGEISKKDPYLEEDEDGIFHIQKDEMNISYIEVGNGIYIFKGSQINKDQTNTERNELLQKYKDYIKDYKVIKDLVIKSQKELKLLINS